MAYISWNFQERYIHWLFVGLSVILLVCLCLCVGARPALAGSPFILTEKERDFVAQAPPLRISYDAFWPPFEEFDAETQSVAGINYEILMLIADLTGLKFEFLHQRTYAEALKDLSLGKSDMHMSYDTNPAKAKELNAIVSDTFLAAPIAMIGKQYSLASNSVFAVSELHPVVIEFVRTTFPNHEMLLFEDINAAYQAVADGVADYTFENVYAARIAIAEGGYPLLRIVNLLPLYDRLSFLFRDSVNPCLISVFNKAIAAFPQDRFSNILLNHTTRPSYVSRFVQFLSYASVNLLVGTIALLAILVAVLFFYTRKLRRARKDIERKRMQVQNMFDAFPMPIYISDMNTYEVLYCNKKVYEFFQCGKIISEPCYKVFQNADEPCSFCTNSVIKNQSTPFIWNTYNKASNKHLQHIDACISWEDQEKARLSIITDITETLELQKEKILEQEANLAKGQFLANMSHEIRTPLNGILGMTRLAMEVTNDDKVMNYLDKVFVSSENLLQIVNDILDFSKIESGKLQLEKTTFSIHKLMNNVTANLSVAARSKAIELRTVLDANVPDYLDGDPLRLTQIIFNIAGNAIKFTGEGSVSIHISVCDACQSNDPICLKLRIEDTGIGISQEQLKTIFTEFSQADVTTTRVFGGTGLGLTISRSLAQLMGGDIVVESELGRGSVFTATLFLHPPSAIPESQLAAPDIDYDLHGVKVLLAEDNEINRIIATEVLESMGCTVTCANDGVEAVNQIHKAHFDIVLMDIQMPHLDGLSASKKIRQDARFDRLPIVAVSAHAMAEDRQKSMKAGMQEHLTKPFDPPQLFETIAHYARCDFAYKRAV